MVYDNCLNQSGLAVNLLRSQYYYKIRLTDEECQRTVTGRYPPATCSSEQVKLTAGLAGTVQINKIPERSGTILRLERRI
jgi:hypothetical protein